MTRSAGKPPSQRQLRVGEMLRHAISEALLREHIEAEELRGVSVTVTEVRPSPDLRAATAFVVPLGGADQEQVVAALNRVSRYLRGLVASRVRQLKFTPSLSFKLDTSFDTAGDIDSLLKRPDVARDLVNPEDDGAPS